MSHDGDDTKVKRLRAFAFSIILAGDTRGFDSEDMAHVLGCVAEVASAADGSDKGDSAEAKDAFVQRIAQHVNLYRLIRKSGKTVDEHEVSQLAATSEFKH